MERTVSSLSSVISDFTIICGFNFEKIVLEFYSIVYYFILFLSIFLYISLSISCLKLSAEEFKGGR